MAFFRHFVVVATILLASPAASSQSTSVSAEPSRAMIALRWLVPTLLAASCATGAAGPAQLPEELAELTRANGCAAIDDFFVRPGMVEPPYVYGVLSGAKEDSAAVWCRRAKASEKPFLLLFKDAKGAMSCPTKIEWWNYPGGLSLETESKVSLAEFRSAKDGKTKGPSVSIPKAVLLVNYYDGVSDQFYCHQGQWLVRSAH